MRSDKRLTTGVSRLSRWRLFDLARLLTRAKRRGRYCLLFLEMDMLTSNRHFVVKSETQKVIPRCGDTIRGELTMLNVETEPLVARTTFAISGMHLARSLSRPLRTS